MTDLPRTAALGLTILARLGAATVLALSAYVVEDGLLDLVGGSWRQNAVDRGVAPRNVSEAVFLTSLLVPAAASWWWRRWKELDPDQ